jgi:hypothetical protein
MKVCRSCLWPPEAQSLDRAGQCTGRETKALGSSTAAGKTTTGLVEDLEDFQGLGLLQRTKPFRKSVSLGLIDWEGDCRRSDLPFVAKLNMLGTDGITTGKDRCALKDVAQFANVAGP